MRTMRLRDSNAMRRSCSDDSHHVSLHDAPLGSAISLDSCRRNASGMLVSW